MLDSQAVIKATATRKTTVGQFLAEEVICQPESARLKVAAPGPQLFLVAGHKGGERT